MPVVAERVGTPPVDEIPIQRSWRWRALPWIGWCLPLVALTIVLHELGHYSAALWVGFPDPALHYSSISHGDVSAFPTSSVGIVGLAGPVVTVLLALFACSWIALRGPARWAFALAVAAVSRFAVGVPYTLANIIIRLSGGQLQPPAFDEHKAASALGWSGDVLLGSTAFFLIGVLVWIAIQLPKGERSAAWAGLVLGTALGWILWMNLLGPVLLA